jgi:D-amino-acid dehydrogenase
MYDVIIVGGGVIGLATAYHCVLSGMQVLLIDRADNGRATDAGAGIISVIPAARVRNVSAWSDFADKAIGYYPVVIDLLESDEADDTGYAECGLILAAVSNDELEAFEAARLGILQRQEAKGLPASEDIREMSADEACEMFPLLAPPIRAIYYRKAARIDGRLFAQALQRAATRHGLVVRRGTVEQLLFDNRRVIGVVVDGDDCRSSKVVIAGGAWSKAFGEQLGIHLPVEPQRGQIVHLRMPHVNTSEWPIVSGLRRHYIVPWPDGRVVVGATRETGSGFEPQLTVAGVCEVLSEALRVAPGLGDGEVREMRVGLRPLSTDSFPILGTVPGAEAIYLGTGHGGSGLQFGPYSGKVLCDLMQGRALEFDAAPFHVARFQSNSLD